MVYGGGAGPIRGEGCLVPQADSGCHIWVGAQQSRGYGLFQWRGRLTTAHRVAYELYNGEIPEDHVVHHRCETPLCVNPEHLEAVTNWENLKLSGRGVAVENAEKTHCPKGHPYEGENLVVTGDVSAQGCTAIPPASPYTAESVKFPQVL